MNFKNISEQDSQTYQVNKIIYSRPSVHIENCPAQIYTVTSAWESQRTWGKSTFKGKILEYSSRFPPKILQTITNQVFWHLKPHWCFVFCAVPVKFPWNKKGQAKFYQVFNTAVLYTHTALLLAQWKKELIWNPAGEEVEVLKGFYCWIPCCYLHFKAWEKPRENLIKQNQASWDECLMFSFTNWPLKFLDGWHQWHNRYVAKKCRRHKNHFLSYSHTIYV